jgi:hypothetical protein
MILHLVYFELLCKHNFSCDSHTREPSTLDSTARDGDVVCMWLVFVYLTTFEQRQQWLSFYSCTLVWYITRAFGVANLRWSSGCTCASMVANVGSLDVLVHLKCC